ncbi:MAG: hydroxyethylthiazole kinase, partial [Chloroflexi bacterium]|nr:hydroxyethylthiazole kinase [Chloroflexota bacterium]
MEKDNRFGQVCAEVLDRVREKHPLIHHMTNFVVMNDTANATLALGALPVMSHAREEVAEMVAAAGALVLNPGTLTPEWVEAMLIAGRRANELGVPVIYDPVGVGATKLRNETGALFLAELKLAVIRGNSGEVGALAGAGGVVKGVESVEGVKDPVQVAREAEDALQQTKGVRFLLTPGCSIPTDTPEANLRSLRA